MQVFGGTLYAIGDFPALVAGGGFKGGHVVGSSDAKGEEVADRPVYPCDLLGSIYELMGIDPEGKLSNPLGLPLTVTPTAADGIPMAPGTLNTGTTLGMKFAANLSAGSTIASTITPTAHPSPAPPVLTSPPPRGTRQGEKDAPRARFPSLWGAGPPGARLE
mgnify:CR=1 FL=1